MWFNQFLKFIMHRYTYEYIPVEEKSMHALDLLALLMIVSKNRQD